jgi:hypothetical protein
MNPQNDDILPSCNCREDCEDDCKGECGCLPCYRGWKVAEDL